MAQRRAESGRTDLIAGIAAVAAFLAMTGVLGASRVWLSGGLSVAVYLAVRWLLPTQPEAQEPKRVSAAERLEELRGRMGVIRDKSAARRAAAVHDRAARLLQYLSSHPLKRAESEFMIGQYLELSLRALELYQATGVVEDAPQQSLQKLCELLDGVAERFQKLYEKLAEQDDSELAGEIKVLNQTLDDLDKVYNGMHTDAGT